MTLYKIQINRFIAVHGDQKENKQKKRLHLLKASVQQKI